MVKWTFLTRTQPDYDGKLWYNGCGGGVFVVVWCFCGGVVFL